MFLPGEIEIINSNLNEESFLEEEMAFIVEVFNLADLFSQETSLSFFDFETFVDKRFSEHRKSFRTIFSLQKFFNDYWNECYLLAGSRASNAQNEFMQIYFYLN